MQRILAEELADEPDFGVMLRYAMGWVDAQDLPYHEQTGKRLRPVLLLLSNQAAGGDWHQALPAAAAVELLHNFSLIHDDIQDESEIRHNRPTVWKVWGMANAINAGDTMFTLAYTALEQLSGSLSAEQVIKIWRIFNVTNLELTRGQHLDMRFETQDQVQIDDYISMISGKSAALIAACTQIGAFIAQDDSTLAEHYRRFGSNVGIAFQIHDDILGIWGDPNITGKSAATDIISRKKSLPVLYGLSQNTRLVELYQQVKLEADDVQEAVNILDQLGTQDYARQQEQVYYERAMDALKDANPIGESADRLHRMVDFLFQRNY